MISVSNFQMNQDNQEILWMNTNELPYLCNYAELDQYIEKGFPWHWHPAFELDYIVEGEIELRTADTVTVVKKGEAFFVNSNVMHDIRSRNRASGCKTYAHIFDMHFLSGTYNSLFEQKYIFPILKSKELQIYVIRPDSFRRINIIQKILQTIELVKQEQFGYEFEIRTELCRIWCMLLEETEDLRSNVTENSQTDVERIKKMMQFIHENYMEKITLDDICASANISSRECTRCFKRCIKISPVNYLNDYRIRMAAYSLLQTNDSILTISERCGFSSGSYFGKVFQEAMGCTPKEFRKKNGE